MYLEPKQRTPRRSIRDTDDDGRRPVAAAVWMAAGSTAARWDDGRRLNDGGPCFQVGGGGFRVGGRRLDATPMPNQSELDTLRFGKTESGYGGKNQDSPHNTEPCQW